MAGELDTLLRERQRERDRVADFSLAEEEKVDCLRHWSHAGVLIAWGGF